MIARSLAADRMRCADRERMFRGLGAAFARVEKTMSGSRRPAISAAQMTCEFRSTTKRPLAACLLTLIFASISGAVCAEVRVSGDVNAMRIEASQSKISEILSALGQEYNVKYRSLIALHG